MDVPVEDHMDGGGAEMTPDDVPDDEPEEKEPPPALLKDPLQPIPIWVETIIRMTLGSFFAFCFGVADLPNAIPQSQAYLISESLEAF